MTKLGTELITGLNEVVRHEKGEIMLKSNIKVIEIQPSKAKDNTRKPQNAFVKRLPPQVRLLHSRHAKKIALPRLPKLSPVMFVNTFLPGPAVAAKVGQEMVNNMEKALVEGDFIEGVTSAQLRNSVGFWKAVAVYATKKADQSKSKKR